MSRTRDTSARLWVFGVVVLSLLGTLLGRLGEVQLSEHADYVQAAATVNTRVITEPAVRGEFHKATATAESEIAKVIAERVGVDATDVYPQLVAAAVGAGMSVAMNHWLRADPPVRIGPLMGDVIARLAAGLPVP